MPGNRPTTRNDAKSRDSSRCSDELAPKEFSDFSRKALHGLKGFEHIDRIPSEEDQRFGFNNSVERLREVHLSGADAVLACEPTADGVLCAVAASYFAKTGGKRVRAANKACVQTRLFDVVVEVQTWYDMAERVLSGFMKHVREGCPRAAKLGCHAGCRFGCIRNVAYIAADVDNDDMPDALFRYVRTGLDRGSRIQSMEADPYTAEGFEIARTISAECEHARQFVRFSKLENGVYFAPYRPKADIVPLVAKYFKRRMGPTPFALLDETHGTCLLSIDDDCQLVRAEPWDVQELVRKLELSDDETYVRAMWKTFYDALALPGRDKSQRGYDLRMKWMPKRLWTYLPELAPGAESAYDVVPEQYAGAAAEPKLQKGGRNLLG
jgi:probable DNA metabolism protein